MLNWFCMADSLGQSFKAEVAAGFIAVRAGCRRPAFILQAIWSKVRMYTRNQNTPTHKRGFKLGLALQKHGMNPFRTNQRESTGG